MLHRWQQRPRLCSVHPNVLGVLSVLILALFYFATEDVSTNVSPQGCRMSYMSPNYIEMTDFDLSWTRLGKRYSLWLYREWGWDADANQVGSGIPVLFVPGNAGSSRQVRSIASSASRQYFAEPGSIAHEFSSTSSGVKPLDFYAVEFNEDLSAFHGPTLEAQIEYTNDAIDYILSKYQPGTKIILMGHSMGGMVMTSLLSDSHLAHLVRGKRVARPKQADEQGRAPAGQVKYQGRKAQDRISVVMTMSTPHRLPPARFDARIERVYEMAADGRARGGVEILSVCGGVADGMIPSEACVLPFVAVAGNDTSTGDGGVPSLGHKTVFSSALEGAWTGVGHREMVWCHQIRWRIARTALEIGAAAQGGREGYRRVLDRWFRDGNERPARIDEVFGYGGADGERGRSRVEVLPRDVDLVLKNPVGGSGGPMYLLPMPARSVGSTAGSTGEARFTLYLSQGSLPPLSPQNPIPLRVSIFRCTTRDSGVEDATSSGPSAHGCIPWAHEELDSMRLIPNPVPGKPFPVPHEGADESEGVVVLEGRVSLGDLDPEREFVGVQLDGADGRGWLVAGFVGGREETRGISEVDLFDLWWRGGVVVRGRGQSELKATYRFPNLLQHALLVYRLQARSDVSCPDTLMHPLIVHTSQPSETHYFPLESTARGKNGRILLHTHATAPYVSSSASEAGLSFAIYSTPGCDFGELRLSVDWVATLGRWAPRYAVTLISWTLGIVGLLVFRASKGEGDVPSIEETLFDFCYQPLAEVMIVLTVMAILPLPRWMFLGNGGEMAFAVIAPLMILIATGLIVVSWWVLRGVMGILSVVFGCCGRRKLGRVSARFNKRSSIISMTLIFVIVFLLVPWQVAYLGCWVIYLYTCATTTAHAEEAGSYQADYRAERAVEHVDASGSSSDETETVPLVPLDAQVEDDEDAVSPRDSAASVDRSQRSDAALLRHRTAVNAYNYNTHMLLLMTWLLPLAAPVLVVWVRTLWTAGLTTPFDGDHFFLNIAPFLVLVEFSSSHSGRVGLQKHHRLERYANVRWGFVVLSVISFFVGPRRTYVVFDVARLVIATLVVVRIGPLYWRREGKR